MEPFLTVKELKDILSEVDDEEIISIRVDNKNYTNIEIFTSSESGSKRTLVFEGSEGMLLTEQASETETVVYHLGCCPQCGSGDLQWEGISVRAYCNDCKWWAPTNYGSKEDGLLVLKKLQEKACVDPTNMI